MTKKQIQTLVLFAQNYSLPIIAKKMNVSLTTTRERIKSLSRNYPKEFNNALAVRQAYKRIRDGLKCPILNGKGLPFFDDWQKSLEHKF